MRKNVIIDILQKGLDPRVAYTSTGKDGTLVPKHSTQNIEHKAEVVALENTENPIDELDSDKEKIKETDTEKTESSSEEPTENKKKNALKNLKKKS